MTLRILHWLADGYGSDARITEIVDTPRGLDRVRRQPRRRRVRHHGRARSTTGARTASRTPARRAIGTDLNRNYGYRWGGGGRTSSQPGRHHLPRRRRRSPRPRRGRCATSSRSRVVGRPAADPGRDHVPRVRAARHVAVRLHAPNVPADMTSHDQAALVDDRPADGGTERLQAPAGERPVRLLAARAATTLYGTYRIFAYTFELSDGRLPEGHRDRARDRAATRRRSCTCSSGPGARWRSWARPCATPAAARSTTTSRSPAAGR